MAERLHFGGFLTIDSMCFLDEFAKTYIHSLGRALEVLFSARRVHHSATWAFSRYSILIIPTKSVLSPYSEWVHRGFSLFDLVVMLKYIEYHRLYCII